MSKMTCVTFLKAFADMLRIPVVSDEELSALLDAARLGLVLMIRFIVAAVFMRNLE